MELSDYLRALMRSWLIVLSCLVIGAAAGFTIAANTAPRYQASTTLFVGVTPSDGGSWNLANSSNYARQAANSYAQIIRTELVLEPVADALGIDTDAAALASRVTASNPVNTQNIEVTVTDRNPVLTVQIANEIAQQFATVVADELEGTSGEDDSLVRIEVLQPAITPSAPSAPKPLFNIALGALIGLAAGIGVAFLRQILDTRIQTVEEATSATGLPLLGAIPDTLIEKDSALSVAVSPRGADSEAYRALRTNLDFVGGDDRQRCRTFVVSSCSPGEGKSTAFANLALAIAETGKRVVLIDADLRAPTIASLFGLEGSVGLTDVLRRRAGLADVLQQWGTGRLFVLASGQLPPNPAELLGSATMEQTLSDLRTSFDVILIDAPPALAVTDAAVVSRFADGALLVAAVGSTRRPALTAALGAFEKIGGNVLGLIAMRTPRVADNAYTYADQPAG